MRFCKIHSDEQCIPQEVLHQIDSSWNGWGRYLNDGTIMCDWAVFEDPVDSGQKDLFVSDRIFLIRKESQTVADLKGYLLSAVLRWVTLKSTPTFG
jgi:hypothetical protein